MNTLALVTDTVSLPIDYDMPLLLDACRANGFATEVCAWEDPAIDWSHYNAVLLRSPWNCVEQLPEFLAWCEHVAAVTQLFNPLPVARWALDKHYLADLSAQGVPVVPSKFIEPSTPPLLALEQFLTTHSQTKEIVVKPTVGSYSRGVQRYTRLRKAEAAEHIAKLLGQGCHVILQPYLESIDRDGETDLIYFDGIYSHAIRKSALLMPDGTVNVPTLDFRKARVADEDERTVALAALTAAASHLGLEQPLLYGRVDLIRDNDGKPMVLELDICEPSLNLPFSEGSATRLVQALVNRLVNSKYTPSSHSGTQDTFPSSVEIYEDI
jgi:O-ureido-D-serine cyclo-ligase